MSLERVQAGHDFHRTHGPHRQRVGSRMARARFAPPRMRRMCSTSSSTTPATGSSVATGRRSTRPTSTDWRKNGLRYTNMHTTALCSPSRSCMLTGRNHHSNGMACITEGSTGYPGSNGAIPFENGFLSEMLLPHGYATFCVGKWHLTPAEQISAAGPYDRWPLGRGFDRYYGFLGGDTHQYYPDLVFDNHQVEPPKTPAGGLPPRRRSCRQGDRVRRRPQAGRARQAVLPLLRHGRQPRTAPGAQGMGRQVQRASSTTAGTHIARRCSRGRRSSASSPKDAELSRHDPDVQQWDDLSDDERKLYARMMEVFAGFFEHTDHQIGRLLDFLEATGQLDNTLIMVISDNGASAEGGPHGSVNENKFFNNVPDDLQQNLAALDDLGGPKYFNHYPWGWTFAGNTPFRRWKRETYRGGVSDPLPRALAQGHQGQGREPGPVRARDRHGAHGARVAGHRGADRDSRRSQSPIEGVSFAHSFDDAAAKTKHHTQYFEMFAHRSLYHDGWRAVCPFPGTSFAEAGVSFGQLELSEDKLRELDATGWELYHVDVDPAETKDLAEQERAKLIEMIALWYAEAGKYNVLPLDSRGTMRFADPRPQIAAATRHLRLLPRHAGGSRERRRQGAQPCAQHHRRRRDSPTVTKACWRATAATSAATCCSSRTASCTTCTTTSAPRNSPCPPTARYPPESTRCVMSSSPPARQI